MKTTYTARDIIDDGQMAYDVLNDNGKFEWFKSEEDGYIYLLNRETNRASRYNSEGQNAKHISIEAYEAARKSLQERLVKATEEAPEADPTPEQVKEALEETEESVNTEEVKRIARRARAKKVRVGGMEFNENGVHVVLTAKQIDFIRHLPDTTFWERGVDSLPWIDCLCDDIGGQFENKPMTVGAMVSTLREKGLLETGVTTINKRRSKYFRVTETGKAIFRKILND